MILIKLGINLVNFDNVTFIAPIYSKQDPAMHEGVKVHFVGGSTVDFFVPDAMDRIRDWAGKNGASYFDMS